VTENEQRRYGKTTITATVNVQSRQRQTAKTRHWIDFFINLDYKMSTRI